MGLARFGPPPSRGGSPFVTEADAEGTYAPISGSAIYLAKNDVKWTMDATGMALSAGTPTIVSGRKVPGWLLDAATNEAVGGFLAERAQPVPRNVDLTARVYFFQTNVGTGNVVLALDLCEIADNGSVDPTATTIATITVAVNGTQSFGKWASFTTTLQFADSAAIPFLRVRRLASDVADTYAADIGIARVEVGRTPLA